MSVNKISTLIVVDPLLKDYAHHHFNYDMSIVKTARNRGLQARLLVDREATSEVVAELHAEPLLYSLAYQPIRFTFLNSLLIGPAFQFLYAVIVRFFDLRRHLGSTVTPDTMVFVPTCDARNLAAWILWCACQPRTVSPVVFLMLRFPCARNSDGALSGAVRAAYALSLKLIRWLDAAERIKLCTDSHLLANQYSELTTRPIAILPIPHTKDSGADQIAIPPSLRADTSVVVVLGDVRKEKGFDILVDAIINATSSRIGQELVFKVHCPVHATHHEMQRHVDRLRMLALYNVYLIPDFLAAREYYSLLDSADIVVMPYRQVNYAYRTSGPLIEAMAAGKIVIGTAHTWLGEQISKYGGGLTFRDGESDSLLNAIITAHLDRGLLREKAFLGARSVRAEHNPEHFLDCLASMAAQQATPNASS